MNRIFIDLVGQTKDHRGVYGVNTTISNSSVSVFPIIQENNETVVLTVQHNHLNTLLDLTNVQHYELWYFNDQKEFTGKAFCSNTMGAPYFVQTQAKYIVLFPINNKEVIEEKLTSFNCCRLNLLEKDPFSTEAFLYHYGVFPYLIIHTKYALYTQIPIHINKNNNTQQFPGCHIIDVSDAVLNSEEKLLTTLLTRTNSIHKKLINEKGTKIELCLVLGPNKAYYFEYEKETTLSQSIPSGGMLLSQEGKIIAMNRKHYL